jgi:hypothetical protein
MFCSAGKCTVRDNKFCTISEPKNSTFSCVSISWTYKTPPAGNRIFLVGEPDIPCRGIPGASSPHTRAHSALVLTHLHFLHHCNIKVQQLYDIIDRQLPSSRGYADDTQLYVSFRPDCGANQKSTLYALEDCISDVHAWLISHKLMFKDTKTEFLVIGTP